MTKLSVIIPILNEEQSISFLLKELAGGAEKMTKILVDGGSRDGGVSIAEKMGFHVVVSERGRGRQMNRGRVWQRDRFLVFTCRQSDKQHSAERFGFDRKKWSMLGSFQDNHSWSKESLQANRVFYEPSNPSLPYSDWGYGNIR